MNRPIAEQPIKLLVTAISVKQHQPRVFGGRGIGDGSFPGITLRDAILASAAAPTLDKAHRKATLTLKKLAQDAVAAHFGEPAFKAFF